MIKDRQCNIKFPVWELGVLSLVLWELGSVCYPTVTNTRFMVPLSYHLRDCPGALPSPPSSHAYGDSPGHACLAISGATEEVITLETGSTDRVANMRAFALAGLKLLQRHLSQ